MRLLRKANIWPSAVILLLRGSSKKISRKLKLNYSRKIISLQFNVKSLTGNPNENFVRRLTRDNNEDFYRFFCDDTRNFLFRGVIFIHLGNLGNLRAAVESNLKFIVTGILSDVWSYESYESGLIRCYGINHEGKRVKWFERKIGRRWQFCSIWGRIES